MKHYRTQYQGSLEANCGVYAAVNSLALLEEHIEVDRLFAYIIRKLGDRLTSVVLHGLSTTEFRKWVLASCIDFCAQHRIIVRYIPCKGVSLPMYWQTMQHHYAHHGAGSIVLGMAGTYHHWTCVRAITDKTMLLADSSDLNRLYRRHVTIDGDAKHRLQPKETFLVTVDRK